jgi:hypothetical protein
MEAGYIQVGLTIVAGGIGSVLLYYVTRIDKKLDRMDERIDGIEKFMDKELRLMDVRLTRIEAHIWPDRP